MFKLIINSFFIVGTYVLASPIFYANDINWKIVGGSGAAVGQFPYQVSLRSNDMHFCSGSILTIRWIVTAAHCVFAFSPSSFDVWAGSNFLNNSGDKYEVMKILVHPEWNSMVLQNDIALIQTNTEIMFGSRVSNIPISPENIDGAIDVVLSGWGAMSNSGRPAHELQFINLKTMSISDCKAMMPGDVGDNQICTFTKTGEGACYGDSGGPLVIPRTNGNHLVGIVSWGLPCARGYPDVYTRIFSFSEWIVENAQ